MMDNIQKFFLPMIPPTVTAQMHKVAVRGNKPYYFDPPELAAAREKFLAYLGKYAPEKPMEGVPVKLHTIWCYPLKDGHEDGEYKITRPDCSNIIKLFEDCMTRLGFWHDDAQIAVSITEKHWARIPGIYVEIEALTNE